MRSELHGLKPNPCPKCKGILDFAQDSYGSYLHCLNCGKFIDLDPPLETPDGSLIPRRKSGTSGSPRSERGRERYQERFKTIQEQGLSIEQAAERFSVSARTIYRILQSK